MDPSLWKAHDELETEVQEEEGSGSHEELEPTQIIEHEEGVLHPTLVNSFLEDERKAKIPDTSTCKVIHFTLLS